MCTAKILPRVNPDFNFGDACALHSKGAKDSYIVNDFSRDTIKNLEEINEVTVDDEEQAVPEFGISSKCMYLCLFGPLICVIVRTIDSRSFHFRSC